MREFMKKLSTRFKILLITVIYKTDLRKHSTYNHLHRHKRENKHRTSL